MELDDGRVSFGDPTPEAHAMVKDPVCGREMSRLNAVAAIDHHGHVYYFCSAVCKQRFAGAPERYILAAET